jgi:hypothetical protein
MTYARTLSTSDLMSNKLTNRLLTQLKDLSTTRSMAQTRIMMTIPLVKEACKAITACCEKMA